MLKALLLCARGRRADVIGQALNQIPEKEPNLILECHFEGVGYGIWVRHRRPRLILQISSSAPAAAVKPYRRARRPAPHAGFGKAFDEGESLGACKAFVKAPPTQGSILCYAALHHDERAGKTFASGRQPQRRDRRRLAGEPETLLVVFHHAAITYGAMGSWFYKEIEPSNTPASLILTLFVAYNQAFFMGLFFLIAGSLTPGAIARHGAAEFLP